jgi:hypothetical protein
MPPTTQVEAATHETLVKMTPGARGMLSVVQVSPALSVKTAYGSKLMPELEEIDAVAPTAMHEVAVGHDTWRMKLSCAPVSDSPHAPVTAGLVDADIGYTRQCPSQEMRHPMLAEAPCAPLVVVTGVATAS